MSFPPPGAVEWPAAGRRADGSDRPGAAEATAVATLGVRVPAWPPATRALAASALPACSPRRRTRAAAPIRPRSSRSSRPCAPPAICSSTGDRPLAYLQRCSISAVSRPAGGTACCGPARPTPPRSPPSSQTRKDRLPREESAHDPGRRVQRAPAGRQPACHLPRGRGAERSPDAGDRRRDEPLGDDLHHAARGRGRRPGAHLHAGRRAALRRASQHRHGLHAGHARPGGTSGAGHRGHARAERRPHGGRRDRARRPGRGRRRAPGRAGLRRGDPARPRRRPSSACR